MMNQLDSRLINYMAFGVLMVSTALGYQFLWGLLFLYWTIPNFYSGRAFLLSEVMRDKDPMLFWAIQVAWVALGLSLVVMDLYPLLIGS